MDDGNARKIRLVVVDHRKAAPAERERMTAGAEAEIAGFVSSVAEGFAEAQRLGPDVLVVDLRMAEGGGAHVFQPHVRPEDQLSRQEERVLELVARGRTNKEIARQLRLSFRTVKNYLSNAFQKLHVAGRVNAAAAYRERQRSSRVRED